MTLRFAAPAFSVSQARRTDYMVPEVNMNKLRIASAVAALTSALALPVWGANATNDGTANLDQQVPSTATQQPAPTTSDSATKARKQTPTAAMDSATPTEKSTTGKSAATKHPPTTEMDRAAPDQKSPGSTSPDTPASTAPASRTSN